MSNVDRIFDLVFNLIELLLALTCSVVVRFESHDEELERTDKGDVVHHWLGHIHQSERDCRTLVPIELGIQMETYQGVDGTTSRYQASSRTPFMSISWNDFFIVS